MNQKTLLFLQGYKLLSFLKPFSHINAISSYNFFEQRQAARLVNSELGAVLEIESYTFQFREQQFSRQQGLDKQFSCCSYEHEVRRGWFSDLW